MRKEISSRYVPTRLAVNLMSGVWDKFADEVSGTKSNFEGSLKIHVTSTHAHTHTHTHTLSLSREREREKLALTQR